MLIESGRNLCLFAPFCFPTFPKVSRQFRAEARCGAGSLSGVKYLQEETVLIHILLEKKERVLSLFASSRGSRGPERGSTEKIQKCKFWV